MSKPDSVTKAINYLEQRHAEISAAVSHELQPFIDGMYATGAQSKEFRIFRESYLAYQEKYEGKKQLFQSITKMATPPSLLRLPVEKAYLLFVYLGTIESVGNSIVDILVMLLVANGRDFHIECRHTTPRIKHVVSIGELEVERVPLTTKLNFLRDNGISELVKIIDSDLRNAIAHLDFEVKEDAIYFRKKPAEAVVADGLFDLLFALSRVRELLDKLAKDRGIAPEDKKDESKKSSQ